VEDVLDFKEVPDDSKVRLVDTKVKRESKCVVLAGEVKSSLLGEVKDQQLGEIVETHENGVLTP
jgi:hypothetical protein